MSSRNQRQLLQLSIATLFLFQVFYFISPSKSNGLLNILLFAKGPVNQTRYELKITSVNGSPLNSPLLVSEHWHTFGIDEKGSAQLLIDEMARALNQNNLDKVQIIYTKLAEEHLVRLDSFSFEVEQINMVRVPLPSGGFDKQASVINSWSSDEIQLTQTAIEVSASVR